MCDERRSILYLIKFKINFWQAPIYRYTRHPRIAISHSNIMNQLQYREEAKNTSIFSRFKSLTSIEQSKLRILKNILCCYLESIRGKKTPSGENTWRDKFYYVLIYQLGFKWTLTHPLIDLCVQTFLCKTWLTCVPKRSYAFKRKIFRIYTYS